MFDGTHMDGEWWFFMTLVWVALVVVIVWAIATLTRPRDDRSREPTPQERLDRRLADGEIDGETYDELSSRLHPDRDAIGAGT